MNCPTFPPSQHDALAAIVDPGLEELLGVLGDGHFKCLYWPLRCMSSYEGQMDIGTKLIV